MAQGLKYQNIQRQEGNWQIVVNPRPGSFEIEVWLINIEGGKAKIANVDKNGYLQLNEVIDGYPTEGNTPFMRVPNPVWELIVNAITDTTPPLKKEVLDAELMATKYHLADMRRLVFDNIDKETIGHNMKIIEKLATNEEKIKLDPTYFCTHGSCLSGECNYKEKNEK